MKAINNFLTSGHEFSSNNNLQEFRFVFLNSLMCIVSLLTLINFLASFFGLIDFGKVFEIAILIFLAANIFGTYLLRKDKSYYRLIVTFFIVSSLILFYFVLLTRKEDEFRLVAFLSLIHI